MSMYGFRDAVADLLKVAGFSSDFTLHPLVGGANNRVFRVEANGSEMLLKVYFHHPDDPRDRLQAEYSFSRFAWKNGVRCLPQPLAYDIQNFLGLYGFVKGRQVQSHEISENAVQQALDFFREVNKHKRSPDATALAMASEACFTLEEHLQQVEHRVQNLRQVNDLPGIEHEVALFICHELSLAWDRVAVVVRKQSSTMKLSLENEILPQDRCLSPSDFGFHNAILNEEGWLHFIDFEYAGWDDPAKMVCDFFCQPTVPVPITYYDMFTESVVADLSEPEKHLERIALLWPVYRLKWCCILLNDFLPVGNARRRFAGVDADHEIQKFKQLQKARNFLQSLS